MGSEKWPLLAYCAQNGLKSFCKTMDVNFNLFSINWTLSSAVDKDSVKMTAAIRSANQKLHVFIYFSNIFLRANLNMLKTSHRTEQTSMDITGLETDMKLIRPDTNG